MGRRVYFSYLAAGVDTKKKLAYICMIPSALLCFAEGLARLVPGSLQGDLVSVDRVRNYEEGSLQ